LRLKGQNGSRENRNPVLSAEEKEPEKAAIDRQLTQEQQNKKRPHYP